mmetsp:Transcript_28008/g.46274  ORF Transcript_28008/g.46274 Transcript_28008/m.46274 type:complete len:466 (-) Transcript_28008:3905-5302(-)
MKRHIGPNLATLPPGGPLLPVRPVDQQRDLRGGGPAPPAHGHVGPLVLRDRARGRLDMDRVLQFSVADPAFDFPVAFQNQRKSLRPNSSHIHIFARNDHWLSGRGADPGLEGEVRGHLELGQCELRRALQLQQGGLLGPAAAVAAAAARDHADRGAVPFDDDLFGELFSWLKKLQLELALGAVLVPRLRLARLEPLHVHVAAALLVLHGGEDGLPVAVREGPVALHGGHQAHPAPVGHELVVRVFRERRHGADHRVGTQRRHLWRIKRGCLADTCLNTLVVNVELGFRDGLDHAHAPARAVLRAPAALLPRRPAHHPVAHLQAVPLGAAVVELGAVHAAELEGRGQRGRGQRERVLGAHLGPRVEPQAQRARPGHVYLMLKRLCSVHVGVGQGRRGLLDDLGGEVLGNGRLGQAALGDGLQVIHAGLELCHWVTTGSGIFEWINLFCPGKQVFCILSCFPLGKRE